METLVFYQRIILIFRVGNAAGVLRQQSGHTASYMKRILGILLFALISLTASADHITGGEMFYNFNGISGGRYIYTVTLKLFMRCNSGRQFPDPAIISVFDKTSNARIQDISQNITFRETLRFTPNDPCITDPPSVCYEVAYYQFTLSLSGSPQGYILASEVNYRIRGITNIGSAQVGATYTCDIPGIAGGTAQNSGAKFTGSDLVVVCAENYFQYSFAASDLDNDNIRYSFCTAYNSSSNGMNGVPAGSPPYNGLNYAQPDFGEGFPLGNKVSINPTTGLISGIAPRAGTYVVTVCAEEIRDNQVIAVQRKDLQINITDCSIASARLEDDYMLCRNTRDLRVSNLSNSPLIVSYDWTVLNPAGTSVFTTTATNLEYTFPVNGVYTIQLIVNKGQPCSDTTTAPVYVFPGTVTNFNTAGICLSRPTAFTDRSSSPSGTINSWTWDFGEPSTSTDFSALQNPEYTYPGVGIKKVMLTIGVSNGCRDTVSKTIAIVDKPPITLAFRDTLICVNDRLQLLANGTGNFSWSPLVNITNALTGSPTVAPLLTTRYYVDLESDGCTNRDSVLVRVVDHVTLSVMNDTTICSTDPIQLRTISDGLRFAWTPAAQLDDASLQSPVATTTFSTSYQVIATIGGCTATERIQVTAVPYPVVSAGNDTTICYNATAQLHGSTDGSSWLWSPASLVTDASGLNPIAFPVRNNNFVLTAYNPASGCPKPGRDTILVTVLPKINAFAGRDTAVIIGQSLQFMAEGGASYQWLPANSLSSSTISNPVGLFTEPSTGNRYKVLVFNTQGCVDSAFITVKVFATLPEVFVPTAFSPNNDGLNDVLRPIAVGIKQIDYFSIYNRWGQLVFTTTTNGHGWDGRINGQPQGSNSYVWMVKATDFNGEPYFKKGTVVLVK